MLIGDLYKLQIQLQSANRLLAKGMDDIAVALLTHIKRIAIPLGYTITLDKEKRVANFQSMQGDLLK